MSDALPRRSDLQREGVLNINKPPGLTSFAVVRKVRKWTGAKKVGHAGTLDPMATGVLIVLTGKATKRSAAFMDQTKEYAATIRLGQQSETDDLEGGIIAERTVPDFSEETFRDVLNTYRGTVLQVPPMYSALRKNGRRLYKLARKGVSIEREPRPVQIYDIELTGWHNPDLSIKVTCGRGTYIRALARDLGNDLKVGGLLAALTRTRIGDCTIDQAWDLDALKAALDASNEDVPET
ncbi:tRNA pseudouridine(55) synthase TruB [bacterium]|nr:tRNA pseudouridine(55) synthase TruB [bacterium]